MTILNSYTAEDQLEIYRTMMGELPQTLFLLDKNKNFVGIFNSTPLILSELSENEIVGNNIMLYVNNIDSPINEVCTMLNDTFDIVFSSGAPLKFQYETHNTYFEITITKIAEERILSQVQDITDIMRKQEIVEKKKHDELTMALTAGGLTSWSYEVKRNRFSSKLVNKVIAEGSTLEQLLSLMLPEHRELTLAMFNRIMIGNSQHEQITVKIKDLEGRTCWNNVHAIPFEHDLDGSLSMIIGSQKDVTTEYIRNEQLHTLVRQNELILNNNNSNFVYINTEFEIEWENVSRTYSDSNLIELISSDNQNILLGKTLHNIAAKAIATKVLESKKHVLPNDAILEIMAQPIMQDGNVHGVVLRIDDITEREHNIQDLAIAKEAAERADRLKSAFLANMSHEIRTPLNSIVGFAQLIGEAESVEVQQCYIDIINTNSTMLLTLVNDILDLSKIEAGYAEYNDEVFDLAALFEKQYMESSIKVTPDVKLILDIPVEKYYVDLDKLKIAQILTNFVTNAIKFTKAGYIRLGFLIRDDGVEIFVEDTGCGMSKEMIPHVFDRFEKLDRFEQGTGLGMAITKAIVMAYNGEIGVESELNKGSNFWAYIPLIGKGKV